MSSLSERIYQAQCFGNVEPIEHMVAYPNLSSLVEGATIKYSRETCFPDWEISNASFQDQVVLAARWLQEQGCKPGDRIQFDEVQEPTAHFLAFATWLIGASLVLTHSPLPSEPDQPDNIKTITGPTDLVVSPPGPFQPTAVPLLGDEACFVLTRPAPVRLSHYQLLVNVNGLCSGIPVDPDNRIHAHEPLFTLSWLLTSVLLPFYARCSFTVQDPDITFNAPRAKGEKSLTITSEWKNAFLPHELYLRPETGGVLCIGGDPIHLMRMTVSAEYLAISGHGVMMGYWPEERNETVFKDHRCYISL